MTKPIVQSITEEELDELEEICRQQAFDCCGNFSIGGEYMGAQERVCCMEPISTERDISWPAEAVLELVARLRAAEKDWAKEALAKGFEYVRESDDHYVVASPEDMVNLLRDVIGIDIRMKDGTSYGESVSELKAQVDGLVNTVHALEEFRKDAARLEWMIASGSIVQRQNGTCHPMVYRVFVPGGIEIQRDWFSTEREAIDAAMESQHDQH